MSFSSLFGGMNFKSTIQQYCQQIGWKIAEIDDKHVVLKFNTEGGRTQTLYIIRFDTTLEFSVPSMAAFDSEDNVPHYFSTLLLKRNSQNKIGFWCIEVINNKQVFSYMHNAELSLMNADYFAKVVRMCVKECDEFEALLIKLLNNR
jgi:hypothetical protein